MRQVINASTKYNTFLSKMSTILRGQHKIMCLSNCSSSLYTNIIIYFEKIITTKIIARTPMSVIRLRSPQIPTYSTEQAKVIVHPAEWVLKIFSITQERFTSSVELTANNPLPGVSILFQPRSRKKSFRISDNFVMPTQRSELKFQPLSRFVLCV